MKPKPIATVGVYVALAILLAIMGFPIFWMLSTSFRHASELNLAHVHWLPAHPTLEAYRNVLLDPGHSGINFLTYFKNSAIICSSTALICVALASLAGYSFSRFRYRWRSQLLLFMLLTQMFPLGMLLVSFYVILLKLNLINTYFGLIIAYISFALPLAIWMLKGFFDTIPKELEEAAVIDGCGRLGAFWRVVLPLTSPGIVATLLFAFLVAWDEYMFALALMQDDAMRTLPPGIITYFVGQHDIRWADMMAGSVIIAIPVTVGFMILSKYLVQGLTSGAVKG